MHLSLQDIVLFYKIMVVKLNDGVRLLTSSLKCSETICVLLDVKAAAWSCFVIVGCCWKRS